MEPSSRPEFVPLTFRKLSCASVLDPVELVIVRVLFVHQNAPGQFRYLAPYLARRPGWQVAVLGQSAWKTDAPLRSYSYAHPRPAGQHTHRYLRRAESCIRRGQTVARACLKFAEEGFTPDLVIGHPGWGELLFVRDALPRTKVLAYCELFYQPEGQDTGYVPETAIDLDRRCRLRTWNADLLVSLNLMDRGLTPTF